MKRKSYICPICYRTYKALWRHKHCGSDYCTEKWEVFKVMNSWKWGKDKHGK